MGRWGVQSARRGGGLFREKGEKGGSWEKAEL